MPRGQTYRDVHLDQSLSNFSIAFWQNAVKFVSGRFFPIRGVRYASDSYTIYPQGYYNRQQDSARAEDGIANSIQYRTIEDTYKVKEDALRLFISDKKRANADPHRNLDLEATEAVTNALLIGREVDFANTFLATSQWTTDIQGVASPTGDTQVLTWADDNSDPVGDVLAQIVTMTQLGAGRRPNKGLMTLDVYMRVREHPAILDRVRYAQGNAEPAQVNLSALAALFELDELVIMETVVNEAVDGIENIGAGTAPPVDNQFLATEKFLLVHAPSQAGLYTATAASIFVWNQYIQHGLNAGPAIRRYRPQDGRKGEFVEGELAIDQKLVSPDLGILMYDLLATPA